MENTKLVDENKYFVESKKAIQIVLENERLLERKISTKDMLQLMKENKKKTSSPEEFAELEKLEKDLEIKIRFNQINVPAVPEEQREKIKRNAAAEQLEADTKLNELKAELKDRIEYLENDLLPLLEGIYKLESMKKIPKQVNAIVNMEIGENAPFPVRSVLHIFAPSSDAEQSKKAVNRLNEVIKALKKIEVPVETKGLLDFLKRGRK